MRLDVVAVQSGFFFFIMMRRPPSSPLFPSTTLSLSHDAPHVVVAAQRPPQVAQLELHLRVEGVERLRSVQRDDGDAVADRKSTRLNSSHANISYAVFCLKKKQPPCDFSNLNWMRHSS